ncbi:MAG: tRNA 2-thiouridine(34) synthase MnmA [Angelakisella sp.]|jgi:tRNA-specific 2-thiouridylase|nr:tRNA 2-thiouridine(34) synthase MnmA [Angelakisella sp.]
MKKKVLVGMSGGVDSSVAAWLLQRQGYEVIGATMKLWEEETGDSRCCGLDDVNDARMVCHALGIPHYVLNCKAPFRREVVEPFIAEYRQGRTPNPCILCNRHLKFDAFLRRALEIGCDYIATGHYARVMRELKTGRHLLCQGKDPKKDQSYVLYTVTQGVLSHLLLPCGEYTKEEIRRFAAESGLPVAKKPDSQDICFVPDGDYAAFIRRYTGEAQPEGWFVDREGNPLGKHRGIGCYTIGQRKGLGIALGRPMFVQAIDPEKNTVTLVEDESLLYSRQVIAGDVNFLSLPKEEFYQLLPVRARVRYSQGLAEAQAVYLPDEERLRLWFREPQRAATPGQAVVLYQGNMVVCGGTILGSRGEEEEEPA